MPPEEELYTALSKNFSWLWPVAMVDHWGFQPPWAQPLAPPKKKRKKERKKRMPDQAYHVKNPEFDSQHCKKINK